MKIALFANGLIHNYDFVRQALLGCDYIIACDGGVRHTYTLQIQPDCLVGDFDSAPPDILEYYQKQGVLQITVPAAKDYTDLALGMKHALEKAALEPSSIVILGATGKRLDHTLANIHVLAQARERGVQAELLDENNRVQVIDKECTLYGNEYNAVSLIPLTTAVTGIVTRGLLYPLHNETLTLGTTRGISNCFTGTTVSAEAVITVETGLLLVICSRD